MPRFFVTKIFSDQFSLTQPSFVLSDRPCFLNSLSQTLAGAAEVAPPDLKLCTLNSDLCKPIFSKASNIISLALVYEIGRLSVLSLKVLVCFFFFYKKDIDLNKYSEECQHLTILETFLRYLQDMCDRIFWLYKRFDQFYTHLSYFKQY